MPTVIFVRHGRSSANASATLAGWMPGVFLDEVGEQQADAVGQRLAAAELPVVEIVSSPLDRCLQTADRIAAVVSTAASAADGPGLARSIHEGLGECRYGAWTGRPLAELAKEELWKVVQHRPSAARFPDSAAYAAESISEMQSRALHAVRETDQRIEAAHGRGAVWVAVSHGDVIKSVLSHAAGAHLDDFQRLQVDPASVSAVHYADHKPIVLRLNDNGGDLATLRPARAPGAREGEGVVGGGSGPSARVET